MPKLDNLSLAFDESIQYESPGKTITRIVHLTDGSPDDYFGPGSSGWSMGLNSRSWIHGTDTTSRLLWFPITLPAPGGTLVSVDVLVADNSGTPDLKARMVRIEQDWSTPQREDAVFGTEATIQTAGDELISAPTHMSLLQPNNDGLSSLMVRIASGTGNGTKSVFGIRYSFTTTEGESMVAPG